MEIPNFQIAVFWCFIFK